MANCHAVRAVLGALVALCAARAAQGQVTIEGVDDADLRERIEAALPEADEPDNRVEAQRIARDAADTARTVLRSQGYYGAEVRPRAQGVDDLQSILEITPGPRFTVGTLQYDITAGGGDAGEAARPPVPPESDLPEAALSQGAPLVADDVITEEANALTRLRQNGYPDATPRERQVIVDHATSDATVIYRLEAGRPAVLGDIRIDSDTHLRRDWVVRLAEFDTGDRYEPEALETLSSRLSGTGAFNTVNVRLSESQPGQGEEQREVVVGVEQGDRHTIELGAGYATSDGVRLEAEWARRNMFGGAETLILEGVAATMERSATATLRAPHFFLPNRTATASIEGIQEETDAYDRIAGIISAGAEQPLSRTLSAAAGISLEQSQVEDRITGRRDFSLVSGYGELRYDDTGSLLDPTSGFRAAIRLEPGAATGDDDLAFVRAIFNVSAYYPATDSITLATRARVGTILGAGAAELPADRRFYAGGGGSVRGYAYQSLGPRDVNNDPLGGRALLELSAEARFRVTGNWGGAVFVDAGTTRRGEIPTLGDLRAGAGAGVRYYTPFGPIRADVAVPLDKRPDDRGFELYISIGQAF